MEFVKIHPLEEQEGGDSLSLKSPLARNAWNNQKMRAMRMDIQKVMKKLEKNLNKAAPSKGNKGEKNGTNL